MKRYGNLWGGMISLENLLRAAHAAALSGGSTDD
jgi:hypothetical protein